MLAALGAAIGSGTLGCQRELSMARVYDEQRAATTIRYRGVRDAVRQYPDYGSIDSSILAPPQPQGRGARGTP